MNNIQVNNHNQGNNRIIVEDQGHWRRPSMKACVVATAAIMTSVAIMTFPLDSTPPPIPFSDPPFNLSQTPMPFCERPLDSTHTRIPLCERSDLWSDDASTMTNTINHCSATRKLGELANDRLFANRQLYWRIKIVPRDSQFGVAEIYPLAGEIRVKCDEPEATSAAAFELTNFGQLDLLQDAWRSALFGEIGRDEYAKLIEEIEFNGTQKHYSTMEVCMREVGWRQGVQRWRQRTWENLWSHLVETNDPHVERNRKEWDKAYELYRNSLDSTQTPAIALCDSPGLWPRYAAKIMGAINNCSATRQLSELVNNHANNILFNYRRPWYITIVSKESQHADLSTDHATGEVRIRCEALEPTSNTAYALTIFFQQTRRQEVWENARIWGTVGREKYVQMMAEIEFNKKQIHYAAMEVCMQELGWKPRVQLWQKQTLENFRSQYLLEMNDPFYEAYRKEWEMATQKHRNSLDSEQTPISLCDRPDLWPKYASRVTDAMTRKIVHLAQNITLHNLRITIVTRESQPFDGIIDEATGELRIRCGAPEPTSIAVSAQHRIQMIREQALS